MAEEPFADQLEKAKASSTAQLLFKCARLWNELGLARMRERSGRDGLRPSHMTLFPHIDLEGTRATTLASRLGISKQAAGALVSDLEAMGIVERIPDPADGRAKLIRFSEDGRRGLLEGLAMTIEMQEELAADIGPQRMSALHDALTHLLAALSPRHSELGGP